MSNEKYENLIAALDIGTSKVIAVIGHINSEGLTEIIGIGMHHSTGLKKGVVVNIEATVESIQRAIEDAELMSGCSISSVHAGIAGNHIKSLNSHGIVAIHDGEVQPVDVDRVIDAARAVAIPADQEILHVLPQEYIIDEQEGVKQPVGMSGVRLEAKVHLVTCAVNSAQNIKKCIKRCGLEVSGLVLEQLASSYAVLTQDEKQLGVALIDIGGGTSDIVIFTDGAIRYTGVIPIAGDQVTNDVAMALRTPTAHAEDLKIKYACALAKLTKPEETIKVPSVGDRTSRNMSRQLLAEVVEPRYDELFTLVQAELRRSGYEELLAAGVVLTGGTSKMEGVTELAEEIFHMPVRVASPVSVTGLSDIVTNPIYSTAIGLLQFGREKNHEAIANNRNIKVTGSIFSKVVDWFRNEV